MIIKNIGEENVVDIIDLILDVENESTISIISHTPFEFIKRKLYFMTINYVSKDTICLMGEKHNLCFCKGFNEDSDCILYEKNNLIIIDLKTFGALNGAKINFEQIEEKNGKNCVVWLGNILFDRNLV